MPRKATIIVAFVRRLLARSIEHGASQNGKDREEIWQSKMGFTGESFGWLLLMKIAIAPTLWRRAVVYNSYGERGEIL